MRFGRKRERARGKGGGGGMALVLDVGSCFIMLLVLITNFASSSQKEHHGIRGENHCDNRQLSKGNGGGDLGRRFLTQQHRAQLLGHAVLC